mgnify:CR=1 FL=1
MTSLPDPSTPLDEATAYQAFADMLDGKPSEEAIEHFLTALTERVKEADRQKRPQQTHAGAARRNGQHQTNRQPRPEHQD